MLWSLTLQQLYLKYLLGMKTTAAYFNNMQFLNKLFTKGKQLCICKSTYALNGSVDQSSGSLIK